MGPLSTVGVDAMAFLHSDTQEQSKVKAMPNQKSSEMEKEDAEEQIELHGKTEVDGGNDGRPDYQLLFMSSWLLGDYWTFVWRTFGLDGPKAWEGSSQIFSTIQVTETCNCIGYYRHLYSPTSLHAVSILPILLRPRSRGSVGT